MKNITNYFTIKRFITAFISLIICACLKFLFFPIITPYLPELSEIYEYLMLGVLFIPIKLAVIGVVDGVHSIFIPETMDTGGGSNPPSLEKAGLVKSHNTQTGVKKGVLSELFPQYMAMNSGGSNRPSSPTGPSQHSQYPPQTGAGRSPQRFWPAHSQYPRPGFSSQQPINQAGPSSTSQPIQSDQSGQHANVDASIELKLSPDLRLLLKQHMAVINNEWWSIDHTNAHFKTPQDKLMFLQNSWKSLSEVMNDQSSEIIRSLNFYIVRDNIDMMSGLPYKKAYYEAVDYFNSDEFNDSKKLMRMIRTATFELHKQGIINTESFKNGEIVTSKGSYRELYERSEKKWWTELVKFKPINRPNP